ncbi:MAG: PilZ domain-containing protein [Myxococcales bacterium]|nr:PilZ domain-containing protein [Myxococcales bacterium]
MLEPLSSEERLSDALCRDVRACLFSRGELLVTCTVEMLSAGGALLSCEPPRPGESDDGDRYQRLAAGKNVRLVLQLPHRDEPLEVTSMIRRAEPQPGGRLDLWVTFRYVEAEEEDRLHDAVLTELIHTSDVERPGVLILEPELRVRTEIEDKVCSVGRHAVCAATAREALEQLDDPDHPVDTLVVCTAIGDRETSKMLEFLVREQRVRVVVVQSRRQALPDVLRPFAATWWMRRAPLSHEALAAVLGD